MNPWGRYRHKCRMCGEGRETLGHVLSACPQYKFTLYKERHDRVPLLTGKISVAGSGGEAAGEPIATGRNLWECGGGDTKA